MKTAIYSVMVFALCLASAACMEPTPGSTGDSPSADSTTPADPLTGTWKGDWGPTADQRTSVTLELSWDGKNLSGSVNPGPDAVAITKGTFAPETGMLTMEASANGNNSKLIRYELSGTLAAGVLSGTWTDNGKTGDFKVTKS